MDSVKTFLKDKVGIEEQEILEYYQRNQMRLIFGLTAFLIEILLVYYSVSTTNWKTRGRPYKLYRFLFTVFWLVFFEVLRFGDPIYKKILSKKKS